MSGNVGGKRIQHSLHSRKIGVDRAGGIVVTGVALGVNGKQIEFPSPTRVVPFNDLLGAVGPGEVNHRGRCDQRRS